MNVLFVNYGDFTTNSLNHIAGFARGLAELGHSCAVAVPDRKETLSAVPEAGFLAVTYAEALSKPRLFPDGRAADILHAWTPREVVRTFVLAYQVGARARLVIHLEDNEEFLLSAWLGKPFEAVRDLGELDLAAKTPTALPHPRRYRHFLAAADGATVIVATLKEFVPPGLPCEVLEPGVDFGRYRPQPADPALRRELGIDEAEKVVVLTGSNTFANEPEMRDLYEAVSLLNARGLPCRLVRTGLNTEAFQASLPPRVGAFVKDLGFLPKARLPALLALADVLVQPGKPGPFNDFRLPSKLPEFLSSGRPVVLPASNIGLELRDGIDALLLREGTPEEIAAACTRIFADPDLARTLAENGAAFARRRFDLAANCRRLAETYAALLAAPLHPGSTAGMSGPETELSLALRSLAARTADPEAARLAADLAPLVQSLERQEIAQAERFRLERATRQLEREAALSRQHASNLSREVEAARKKIFRIEESLRLTRQHAVNLEQVRSLLQRLLRERDRRIAQLEARFDRTIADRDQTLAREADRLAQREAKIRTMERSLSWKITLPLRFLRRKMVDPFRKKDESTVSKASTQSSTGAGEPAPRTGDFPHASSADHGRSARAPSSAVKDPSEERTVLRAVHEDAAKSALALEYSIDHPQGWSVQPGRTLLRGWCYSLDGTNLVGVRAVLPGRTVAGTYGLRRPDVAGAAPGRAGAERSGWQISIEFSPDDTQIDLEIQDDKGSWHPFVQTSLQIGEASQLIDLVSYEQWADTFDTLSVDDIQRQVEQATRFAYQPLISVLMPVFNPPELWLRKAIDSVNAQTYPNWELCIADDASSAPHVRPMLEKAAAENRRIRVAWRTENGHISAASNSALALAKGAFVTLLDHDDELAPNALFEVARVLQDKPEADFLYSDEDKIDESGRRNEPYFKPDWLPDLFLGQNYASHLSVYRASLVRSVGGFRLGYEGSQDWDLALRIVERTTPERIVHIPRILYHWRAIAGSTALLLSEKDYHAQAAFRAISDHFARMGQTAQILPVLGGHWRVKYPLPSEPPLISLIIPTRNALSFLKRCVDSILEKTTYPNYEVLVVDNDSDDPATLAYLRSLAAGKHRLPKARAAVRVLGWTGPFNFSSINNFAVREAKGEVVGLLNNDLEVINADWLEEMVSQSLRPEIGCVGAMLYYPDDTIQHAGCILGIGGVAGHAFKTLPRGTEGKFNRARLAQNYSAVTAACLLVRKSVYEQVGGFDENALAVAFNDIDFCLKVRRAGYRNLWTPFAEFYHHESASRGADDTPEKARRFQMEVETMVGRWGALLREDPAYNPNLSLEDEAFSLAAPPRPWTGPKEASDANTSQPHGSEGADALPTPSAP